MKSKKIKIAPDKMQKLLQRIAEEERKLDQKNLTESELEDEEIRINRQIIDFLNENDKESPTPSGEADTHQFESHWDQIQRKIESLPDSESSESRAMKNNSPSSKLRVLPWPKTRQNQVVTLLAAAAVLFVVISQLPLSPLKQPVGPGDSDFLSKGKNATVAQNIVCDYKVAWHAVEPANKLTDAEVFEDQSSYLVPLQRPTQVLMKCLSHRVFVHLKFIDGEQVRSPVVLNQKLEPNQWNLLPEEVQSSWFLTGKDGKFLVFITSKEIDEDTLLPSESTSVLDQEDVIAFFEVPLKSSDFEEPL